MSDISCSTCRYWISSSEANEEWGFCKLSDPSVPETLTQNIIVMRDDDNNLFEVQLEHKKDMQQIFSMTLCSKDHGCVQYEKLSEL